MAYSKTSLKNILVNNKYSSERLSNLHYNLGLRIEERNKDKILKKFIKGALRKLVASGYENMIGHTENVLYETFYNCPARNIKHHKGSHSNYYDYLSYTELTALNELKSEVYKILDSGKCKSLRACENLFYTKAFEARKKFALQHKCLPENFPIIDCPIAYVVSYVPKLGNLILTVGADEIKKNRVEQEKKVKTVESKIFLPEDDKKNISQMKFNFDVIGTKKEGMSK